MEKIKQFFNQALSSEKGKDILIVFIVILVGLGSFELGRLSNENSSSGIKIDYPNGDSPQSQTEPASVISATSASGTVSKTAFDTKTSPVISNTTSKPFFASSKGSKYYSIGCSAGKTIKQENRVYFATGEAAQAARYTLSSSCK